MDASARLGLAYLASGQLQKHIALNEALSRLDLLVQTRVRSRSVSEQPTAPADGDLYILTEDATGAAWSDRAAGALVRFDVSAWIEEQAPEGLIVTVADEATTLVREAGGWTALGRRLGEVAGLSRFGLGAEPDADNPFTARLAKALWTAPGDGDGGDLRMTLNKTGPDGVLSLLFQSGWAGRAELGLVGDDDLTLRVSDDGVDWREAMRIDRASGRAEFPQGSGRVETTVVTEDAVWTPPAWARRVEALCVGAGGGGGSGMAGPDGEARYGGGGGGAGHAAAGRWPAQALDGPLALTIGSPGEGGAATASGAGEDGLDGEETAIRLGGAPLLTGAGGAGGSGGAGLSGTGGASNWNVGHDGANAGGSSRVDQDGEPGEARRRPDGAGGGGAGGGLDAMGAARAGGAGGDGGSALRPASGGQALVDAAGGAGDVGADPVLSWAGGGGGGGGSGSTGHAGGAAGPGGGGGGGGAGRTASGVGGSGGAGLILLTAIG